MDIEQIMIDYFEGDTNLESERKMFSAMSYDDSLILEFKDFFQINNAMKESVHTFTSPTNSTNELFTKLGFFIPPTIEAKTPFAFLKSKWFGYVATTIVAVALTVAIMLFFFYPNQTIIYTDKGNMEQVNQTNDKQIPIVKSQDNSPELINTYKHQAQQISKSVQNINVNNTQSQLLQTNEPRLTLANTQQTSMHNLSGTIGPIINLPYNYNLKQNPFQFYSTKPIGVWLGISGFVGWSIPKATLGLNNVSQFNNLAISLYYDISDKFKIGAEARQETFYTEYTGRETNDSMYKYQQQSNLTSFTSNVRYSPLCIGLFNPYIGVNLGANRGGFIARPNAGLEYQPYPDIAFTIGFEYTYFRYQHQNKWFGASKAGINYGLLIKY